MCHIDFFPLLEFDVDFCTILPGHGLRECVPVDLCLGGKKLYACNRLFIRTDGLFDFNFSLPSLPFLSFLLMIFWLSMQ